MKDQILFLDDYHPPRLNVLLAMSWRARSKVKKEAANVFWIESKAQGLEINDGVPRRVDIDLVVLPRGRLPDPDAFWKVTLDALVKCGLLVDDAAKWCQPGEVTFERGKRKSTTIRLTTPEK